MMCFLYAYVGVSEPKCAALTNRWYDQSKIVGFSLDLRDQDLQKDLPKHKAYRAEWGFLSTKFIGHEWFA